MKKFNQIATLETDSFRDWDNSQIVCYFLSALTGIIKECIDLYVTRPNIDALLDELKRTLRDRFIDSIKGLEKKFYLKKKKVAQEVC